jgi:hypothetical protein
MPEYTLGAFAIREGPTIVTHLPCRRSASALGQSRFAVFTSRAHIAAQAGLPPTGRHEEICHVPRGALPSGQPLFCVNSPHENSGDRPLSSGRGRAQRAAWSVRVVSSPAKCSTLARAQWESVCRSLAVLLGGSHVWHDRRRVGLQLRRRLTGRSRFLHPVPGLEIRRVNAQHVVECLPLRFQRRP